MNIIIIFTHSSHGQKEDSIYCYLGYSMHISLLTNPQKS